VEYEGTINHAVCQVGVSQRTVKRWARASPPCAAAARPDARWQIPFLSFWFSLVRFGTVRCGENARPIRLFLDIADFCGG